MCLKQVTGILTRTRIEGDYFGSIDQPVSSRRKKKLLRQMTKQSVAGVKSWLKPGFQGYGRKAQAESRRRRTGSEA
jgi:hypothetical protein